MLAGGVESYTEHDLCVEAAAVEDESGVARAWSWGAGTDGQLGTGSFQDEYLPQPLPIRPFSTHLISSVACGGAHSVTLTGEGRVFSWGRGSKGQLGHGDLLNSSKPKLVESLESHAIMYVSAGWNHSGFVSNSGHLFMCGDGSFGQLGTGDYQSHSSPVGVPFFASELVEQVACGMRHSLVLVKGDQENTIYGFGSAKHGQVGVAISGPLRSNCYPPKVVHGFKNHKMVHIYANGDQSAALSADGQLYTWGRGLGGGHGNQSPSMFPSPLRFSQVALGWNHALLVANGEAYMLGGQRHGLLNSCQQLKEKQQQGSSSAHCSSCGSFQLPPLERVLCSEKDKVVRVAAGAEHSALVTERGKIMTWGWGEHGQLGLGNTSDQIVPHIVNIGYKGRSSGAEIGVYCGSGFTVVVDQAIHCHKLP